MTAAGLRGGADSPDGALDEALAHRGEPRALTGMLDQLERVPLAVGLAVLFAFSLALRLYYLNDGLFLFDSVVLARAVEETIETGVLQGQVNGRQGSVLIGLLAHLPDYWLTGEASAERALLFLNALLSSGAVVALVFFGRFVLRDAVAAWSAALLFSLSPIYLSVSTWAKPHGLEAFLLLSCFALLARPGRTPGALVASSFLYGTALMCREATLLFLPLYLLLYLHPEILKQRPFLRIDPRARSASWLAAAFVPLLVLALLASWLYLGEVVLRTLSEQRPDTVTFTLAPTPQLITALSDLVTDLTPIGVLLLMVGALRLSERQDLFPLVLLGAWAALIYPVGNTTAYWPRLLAILSPPLFLMLGAGTSWLYARTRPLTLLVVVVVGAWMFATVEPLLSQRRNFSGEKEQALWLRSRVPPGGVVVAMDDSVFIEYYAGLETLGHPIDDAMASHLWAGNLKARIASGTPVFIITSAWSYDATATFARSLAEFRLEELDSRLIEDYHRAALADRRYTAKLFQIFPRDRI